MPSPEPSPPPLVPRRENRSRPGCLLVFLLGFAAIVAVSATAFYFLFFKGPAALADKGMETAEKSYGLARKIAKDLVQVLQFQPRVTIGSEVVYEPTQPILELATAERKFAQTYTFEHRWLGSTKRLALRGEFVAKAGYDLTQPFEVGISRDGKEIHAKTAPAKILSVELLSDKTVVDEPGLWNELNTQDRDRARNELLKLARANVEKSNLRAEAAAELFHRLQAAAEKQNPLKVVVTLSENAREDAPAGAAKR